MLPTSGLGTLTMLLSGEPVHGVEISEHEGSRLLINACRNHTKLGSGFGMGVDTNHPENPPVLAERLP